MPPAISPTWALTFPTSLAALTRSFDLILTFGFFGIAALRLFMPFLRPPLDAAASAIAPPAPAIAAPPATSGPFALLATLPTVWPAPPTAFFTASTGLEPPPAPLLKPLELGAFDFAFDFEPDDLALGFLDDPDFADFGFAAFDLLDEPALFDFEALGLAFDFDCDFGFDLDLLDEPALFDAGCFLDLVSAIFLSPRKCPY